MLGDLPGFPYLKNCLDCIHILRVRPAQALQNVKRLAVALFPRQRPGIIQADVDRQGNKLTFQGGLAGKAVIFADQTGVQHL
jgi:hypothetical protein